ncbi:MAG: glycine cleavage system protein GcvH [Candidatus Neomarinimicrobiota bacterium]|nr:glycine cleavage system protein GcvH [Candidatus Neomarinimicrobiota bacterium]GIS42461.1 MAG: glycine cleavage system protein GcvH [Candidatus Neomarinimicrobiota bacterium]
MNIPENLLYTSEHEWIKIDGEIATIGVTDFAQSELGDIIFLEFPDLNSVFNKGDIFGTIEAVKTVSDLYMPIDGEICEINDTLNDSPEKVNEDPYKDGWMVKVKIDKSVSLDGLLDSNQYNQLIT